MCTWLSGDGSTVSSSAGVICVSVVFSIFASRNACMTDDVYKIDQCSDLNNIPGTGDFFSVHVFFFVSALENFTGWQLLYEISQAERIAGALMT